MQLSDSTIHKMVTDNDIVIYPYNKSQLQSASYDLHVGDRFATVMPSFGDIITLDDPQSVVTVELPVSKSGWLYLEPKANVLAYTSELVRLPRNIVAYVDGKSTLGRMGLLVHATAGLVDPGFGGNLTLELYNLTNYTMAIRVGMPIAQISFVMLDAESVGYKGRYQDSVGVVGPRPPVSSK